VHPSLIINMDQTGVHLVPSARFTYAVRNSSSVEVIGADDKRQITACVASAMDGAVLPLQLIFQGKTERCQPPATAASLAAHVDITHSENHWSSQQTMQRYIEKVLIPYAERCIQLYALRADAKIILVLDVWSVHKSEEFRRFLRSKHPRIHLVFVPPNCTSKLQVADVALQRPFKAAITSSFNAWAAEQIGAQLRAGAAVGVAEMLKMSNVKPLALEWCVASWTALSERKPLVLEGWRSCCLSLFDVMDPEKQTEALAAVHKQQLDHAHIFEEEEQNASDHDSDSDSDVLDISAPRSFGQRKSTRESKPAAAFGYQLNSQRVAMTEDSDN
jgi:hypothetical protein